MNRKTLMGAAVVVVLAGGLLMVPRVQFILGGALVNVGYRFQDHLHAYDLEHHEDITPAQVWDEFKRQNELAASVRDQFPRSTRHPVVALLVCMDARIDTNELTGDTRRNYYIVRTAGSVIGAEEADMLELAVNNGVKVLVLSRHSDCAAEKAAKDPAAREKYPALVQSVDERDAKVKAFLARPVIAEKLARGELLVKEVLIHTENEHLVAPDGSPLQ
ncbi:MAG: carbonic anhydrase [Myxococcota bacterium]